MTSDFGILPRRAQRVRRAARPLSSLTVIVGMVIRSYYHAQPSIRRGMLIVNTKARFARREFFCQRFAVDQFEHQRADAARFFDPDF